MKEKAAPSSVRSSREILALATLFTVSHAAAQAPAKPAEAEEKKKGEASNEALPEVHVTADRGNSYKTEQLSSQKSTAPLLDTPQTFTVIPQAVYKQQAATSLADVLKNTPGITYNAGENGFASGVSSFNMRGFESSNNVFVDGSRDQGNYSRDIFNIESVEVAKGPAGDNGRGAAGGYVNLVTKTPGLEEFYSGGVSYGFDETNADSRFRTTFDSNYVVKESPIQGTALRLNGMFQEGGVAGRDYAQNNAWGVAPSIAFGLGTDTRLTFAYQYLEQNNLPDYGIPANFAPGIINTTNIIPPANDPNRDTFYGRTSDYDDISNHSFLMRFEHDFASGLKFSNQTRWAQSNRFAIYTVPFGVLPAAPAVPTQVDTRLQANDRITTTFSNLSNFGYEFETGQVKHTLAAGLELNREESKVGRNFTNLGAADPTDINHPDPSRPRPVGGKIGPAFHDEVTVDTVAVYAYDNIQFNSQWSLNGGLRVEYYDAEVTSNDPAYADYNTDDLTLSGKLGVVYKPVANGSIYAAAGVSAQPPGGEFLSNPDASRAGTSALPGQGGQNAEDSDTQLSYNYEIGTKWDFFENKLSTTLAAFYSQRDNVAFGTEPDLSYGSQDVYGLELGVAGSITENWNVFGGIAYMESNSDVNNTEAALAFAPRWSANLFSTYRFAPIGLTVGGGLQYQGKTEIGRPSNTGNGSPGGNPAAGGLDDFITFNLMAAYEVTDNVTLRLNVDNVFDEAYSTSANYPGRRVYLGAPRTYTISADWKF